MKSSHKPITDIPLEGLPGLACELGLKAYTARQLVQWIYKKGASSFDEMTNVSKHARGILEKKFVIDAAGVSGIQHARDGTKKYLLRLFDGAFVECVMIPAEDGRLTVCLSTQVGCAMGCRFCRTAGMGFVRNLTQGEILTQLLIAVRQSQSGVTNVVLMGMGEPLANVDAVSQTVRVICEGSAFGFSKRRVTLSTCGLVPELEAFVREFEVKVAISLNATTDEVRNELMPVNRRYPIGRVMEFCRDYSNRSRHRITFEYVMIRGVNDTMEDAKRLVRLLGGVRAKVNLIPFNPFEGCPYEAPEDAAIKWWSSHLYEKGVQVNIRMSHGQDILAACGQLATTHLLRTT